MLKMLVACARNSSTRDSFRGTIFVKAMSNTLLPGPMMLLRRAMGKKDPVEMAKQRDRFQSGAAKLGHPKAVAEQLFDYMEKFAGYGFNKSHSAAYALVAYQTCLLYTSAAPGPPL